VGSHANEGGGTRIDAAQWNAVGAAYEEHRRNGSLPATYEVVYGHAWKAAPRKLADGRQVIDFQARR
jgi:malonyl-CoA O-methyltransferase